MPTVNPALADGPREIALAEVLSALSHALDLTEGQPLGHTIRAAAIGMRIAEVIDLPQADRSALYYALLLKDAGCSSNAARMSAVFASDDRTVKHRMKRVDWHRPAELAIATARLVAAGGSLRARWRQLAAIAREPDVTRGLIAVRCERGAEIALALGFPRATADAIRSLDEHWDGGGYPDGLRGAAIPLLARIANVAQVVEVFHRERSLPDAIRCVRRRRGQWFDPRLADAIIGLRRDHRWWSGVAAAGMPATGAALEPAEQAQHVDAEGLDRIAEAFAGIIDAKSPYTAEHSSRVARHAGIIALELSIPPAERRRLHRAALLHDIGKLGVSNRILDKAGPLTSEEREAVERHPLYTWQILSRVGAFHDFAWMAAVHHERLDGSGYPWGLRMRDLDLSARVLGVADVFEALTADRPYRAGLPPEKALRIVQREAGSRLCAECADALGRAVRRSGIAAA